MKSNNKTKRLLIALIIVIILSAITIIMIYFDPLGTVTINSIDLNPTINDLSLNWSGLNDSDKINLELIAIRAINNYDNVSCSDIPLIINDVSIMLASNTDYLSNASPYNNDNYLLNLESLISSYLNCDVDNKNFFETQSSKPVNDLFNVSSTVWPCSQVVVNHYYGVYPNVNSSYLMFVDCGNEYFGLTHAIDPLGLITDSCNNLTSGVNYCYNNCSLNVSTHSGNDYYLFSFDSTNCDRLVFYVNYSNYLTDNLI